MMVFMGIIGIKDAFSAKYPTMQIFGPDGSWHLIPLRKTEGSVIFVKISNNVYPFLLDYSKLKTYRYRGAKIIQTILYSIDDIFPIDTNAMEKLRAYSEKNQIGSYQYDSAALIIQAKQALDSQEDKDGYISVSDIISNTVESDKIEIAVKNLFESTGIVKLTRPSAEVSEFLSTRLTANPSTLANAFLSLKQMDWEWRKIANPAKGPFKHWMLIIGMAGIATMIAGVLGFGYMEGWFSDSIAGGFDIFSLDSDGNIDWLSLQSQYPDGPPDSATTPEVADPVADPPLVAGQLDPNATENTSDIESSIIIDEGG